MSKLIIGIGVPGCGKTTLLKPLAQAEQLAYINADDIRLELTGDMRDHTREIDAWKEVYERAADALQKNGALVDATFSKRRDRRSIIAFCKERGATEIVAYVIDTPLDVCKQRNEARDQPVPDEVIDAMANRLTLTPPTRDEGFDEIKIVSGLGDQELE